MEVHAIIPDRPETVQLGVLVWKPRLAEREQGPVIGARALISYHLDEMRTCDIFIDRQVMGDSTLARDAPSTGSCGDEAAKRTGLARAESGT